MDDLTLDDFKETFHSLLEITTCSICLHTVRLPMVQCVDGHVVCEECKKGVEKCPLCKDHFSSVQVPFVLKQVVEALPRRCKYINCPKYFMVGSDHEKYCGYNLTFCELCQWEGPGKDILAHVTEQHPELSILKDNEPKICWDDFDPEIQKIGFDLFSAHSQIFWEKTTNDPYKKC